MVGSGTTLAIAICGVVVAAATAGWNIYRDGFRDRARLKLSMYRGYFMRWAGMPPQPGVPSPGTPVIFVKAANVGRRPLTITGGGGVDFPDGMHSTFTSPPLALGKRLEEGEEITLCNPEDDFQEKVEEHGVPTHIWFADASDKRHRKRIPRNLRSWLEDLAKKEPSGR